MQMTTPHAATIDHTCAAQISLSALINLFEVFSRRPMLELSPSTIEYLLGTRDKITENISRAILAYGQASGLPANDLAALRTTLDIPKETE